MGENAVPRPPRVLVPELAEHRGTSEKKEILLRKEERDHVRARRLRDGSEVIALDGKGARARARLARGGEALCLMSFEEIPRSPGLLPGEPANRVTIALACAEPARVEWAIEKGTECGAAGFVLLDAERSQRSHVAALSKRIPRLVRIAEEAVKQCDRTIVPTIEGPEGIEDFLRKGRGAGQLVLLVPESSAGRLEAGRELVVAIGPEGGFSPSEISLFAEKSPVFLSLGPRILRLETAVVVALSRLVDPA